MDEADRERVIHLRTGVSIYPSQYQAIYQVLAELCERGPAQLILLTDTSGLLVACQGAPGEADLAGLGSLIAGDLAASQEIARLTGQYQNYQLVMREGAKSTSLISEAGRCLVLFVQISSETPLGWARILIREACRQLAQVLEAPPELTEQLDLGLDDENLAERVGDALDALWTD